MLALAFLHWWYGPGWLNVGKGVLWRVNRLALSFSVPDLIMTLFEPWRRVITYGGESIQDRLRALLDNLVSRCVGFSVRLIVIFTALILIVLMTVVGAVCFVLWPLLPVAAIGLIVRGFLPW